MINKNTPITFYVTLLLRRLSMKKEFNGHLPVVSHDYFLCPSDNANRTTVAPNAV